MRYLILILILIALLNCSNRVSNFNDKGPAEIDIYNSEMTYEKFKQTVIDYADKATYPSLTN